MVIKKNLFTAMNAKLIGSGKETIVLAHGYGGDQSLWEKVLPYFIAKSCYQVLLFDWCFSGAIKEPNDLFDAVKYSSYDAFADDLIDLMDEINLKSSILVGHSMSGMIGCIASVKRPDLFKKLLLVSTSPRFINVEDYEGGFNETEIDQLLSNIELKYNEWASIFPSIAVDANDSHSVKKFERCLTRMKPEIALTVAKIVFLSDERGILEKVTTPCTIIHTKTDFVVPSSIPEYIQKKINAKSSIEIIDTIGHFPQLTAPIQFLQVLDRALTTTPEPDSTTTPTV